MKNLMMAIALMISGCASQVPDEGFDIMEKCACCRSCTTDYECEVGCEKNRGCDCQEFSAIEEMMNAEDEIAARADRYEGEQE